MRILIILSLILLLSGCSTNDTENTSSGMESSTGNIENTSSDKEPSTGVIYRNTKTGEEFNENDNSGFKVSKDFCIKFVDEKYRNYDSIMTKEALEDCLRKLGYESVE
jgi:hypothetical protein